MNEGSGKADTNIDGSVFWWKSNIGFFFLSSWPSTATLGVVGKGEVCEDMQEEDRGMGKEGFQGSPMPAAAGEEADKEARKENGGHDQHSSLYQTEFFWNCKCEGFADECESTGKEEGDEAWWEKSSKACGLLLVGKNLAWTHLQVFGDAQRGGEDRCGECDREEERVGAVPVRAVEDDLPAWLAW